MNIWVLLSLITAHLIGDFYLQSDKQCQAKEKAKFRSPFLYLHAAVMGAFSWLLVPTADFVLYALGIFVTHLLIDGLKSYLRKGLLAFAVDQLAHLSIICLIAYLFDTKDVLPIHRLDFLDGVPLSTLLLATICCLKPTNILIKLILERYRIGETEACNSIKSAGALIGNLERILAVIFVVLGHYEAVGFILATKSLLRFKESDTAKTEYVLAGTLLSFAIATLCGLAVVTTTLYLL